MGSRRLSVRVIKMCLFRMGQVLCPSRLSPLFRKSSLWSFKILPLGVTNQQMGTQQWTLDSDICDSWTQEQAAFVERVTERCRQTQSRKLVYRRGHKMLILNRCFTLWHLYSPFMTVFQIHFLYFHLKCCFLLSQFTALLGLCLHSSFFIFC